MSSLRKSLLSKGSKRMSVSNKDFSPVKWTKYFDSRKDVIINGNSFNVYVKGDEGPVIVALHGGGYSGLTWALFAEEITAKVCCHVLAIDLRGHGLSETDDDTNLALSVLAGDVSDIVYSFYKHNVPPVILIGHSMGGAIAVEAANVIQQVVGLCVIDVVEGSALESLSAMQSILRGRPTNFQSLEHAIQWSFRSGQTHNLEAARVSVPGQVKNSKTGKLGTVDVDILQAAGKEGASSSSLRLMHQQSADSIAEVDETEGSSASNACAPDEVPPDEDASAYTWRIDLSKTERFWNGWFKGLSQKFLTVSVPKVLLLANIHGLDTTLTIGQMQGKFQMQVLHKSGHAIHEDQPTNVADIVSGFLVKQKITTVKEGFTPVMPAC